MFLRKKALPSNAFVSDCWFCRVEEFAVFIHGNKTIMIFKNLLLFIDFQAPDFENFKKFLLKVRKSMEVSVRSTVFAAS